MTNRIEDIRTAAHLLAQGGTADTIGYLLAAYDAMKATKDGLEVDVEGLQAALDDMQMQRDLAIYARDTARAQVWG